MESEMKELLSSTGFKLKKWSCNSTNVLQDLQPEDLAPSLRKISENWNTEGSVFQKTLGLFWDTVTDQLYLEKPDWKSCKRKPVIFVGTFVYSYEGLLLEDYPEVSPNGMRRYLMT